MTNPNYHAARQRRLRFVLALSATLAFASASHAASQSFVWLPNNEPDVAGYRIYYGTPPGHYSQQVDVGNVTRATISGLTPGAAYRFYATCYNTAGLESDPSDVVELLIPDDNSPNRPPVALGSTLTATSGEITTITLAGQDPDGDPLSFNIAAFPRYGELLDYPAANGQQATLTYRSPPGYTGTDEFQFTVNNGWVESEPATVSIQVSAAQTNSANSADPTDQPLLTDLRPLPGQGVILRWFAVPGQRYQIVYSDRLETSNWTTVPVVIQASDTVIEVEHPLPPETAQRFYRVVRLP